jgi:hypothetical protein
MNKWKDNHIQFARYIAEIGRNLSKKQTDDLCASMDLSYDQINEIVDRAEIEWIRVKNNKNVRKVTPQTEIDLFNHNI